MAWSIRRVGAAGAGVAAAVLAIALADSGSVGTQQTRPDTGTVTDSATVDTGGGGSVANLWIDTNGGTCTRQSTAGAYNNAAACSSMQTAYSAASGGDTVGVKAGSYGGQNVNTGSKASTVTFRPAAGETVTFADLDFDAPNIALEDFTSSADLYLRNDADNFSALRVHSANLFVRGTDGVTLTAGEVGPNLSNEAMNWVSEDGTGDGATNVTLDRMNIHDVYARTDDAHVDCLGVDDVDGFTVRRSTFNGCSHFSMIFGNDFNGESAQNVLVENSTFDCCYEPFTGDTPGFYAVAFFGETHTNVTFRFNSVKGGFSAQDETDVRTNFVIDSNVFDTNNSLNCSVGSWDNNVAASGSGCAGGTVAPTGWVAAPDSNGDGENFDLQAGAAAVGFGNASSFPSVDYDGVTRGNPPDSGAYER